MKPPLIFLLSTLATCPLFGETNANSTAVRHYVVAAHGTVSVEVNRADIVIEPSKDRLVHLTAHEHAAAPNSFATPNLSVSVKHSLIEVQIKAEDSEPCSTRCAAKLVLQIPQGLNVRIRDGQGDIRVGDVHGIVDAATHSGVVRRARLTQLADSARAAAPSSGS